MRFDELQVIWNAQQLEPLFAIDRQAMHNLIRRKSANIQRNVKLSELTVIAVSLLVAIMLPVDAWREGDGWHPYVVALICLLVGLSMLFIRWKRHRGEITFDRSVKAIAERGVARIDLHIRTLRMLFWCFHIPIALCAAIGLTVYSNTSAALIWAGVMLVTGISYWGTQHDIRKKLVPQRCDLENLRVKLAAAEEISARPTPPSSSGD